MFLENSIGFIINRTALKMKNELHKGLSKYGITPDQWIVLAKLFETDGLYQKELAEKVFKDQPTITRILDNMVQSGLVVRQMHPEDRRAFCIVLTDKGKERYHAVEPLIADILDRALQGISNEQRDTIKILLNRIYENLN